MAFEKGNKLGKGRTPKADKEKVNNLYQKYISNELGLVGEFPFIHKWEPSLKHLNILRSNDPSFYNKYFAETLTIKPKKPAFEVKKSELN